MQYTARFCLIGTVSLIFGGIANAQQVDCQQILNSLLRAGPGVYSPAEAQQLANTYNTHCLGSQSQYQQPYQVPNQQQYQPPYQQGYQPPYR